MPLRPLSAAVVLRGGLPMPRLGLGTCGAFGGVLQGALEYALALGYRHIDTAHSYGNEADIGAVLAACGLPRRQLFITTKVPAVHLGSDGATDRALDESLRRLRTDYVDLLLVHHPWGRRADGEWTRYDLADGWRRLEAAVRDGRARSIGVSNFTARQLQRVCAGARVPPAVLQFECNVYLQQAALREACAARGIVATAYSPLGSPARQSRFRRPTDAQLLTDPAVAGVAAETGRSPAQVLLRFLLQCGVVPLPKAARRAHLADNMAAAQFALSDDHMRRLRALERGLKLYRFEWFAGHPEYHPDEPF